jgi:Tfp pilus assembly protein PilF
MMRGSPRLSPFGTASDAPADRQPAPTSHAGIGATRTPRGIAWRAALTHFAARRHADAQAALEALITLHGEDAESLLLLATLRLAADADAAEALLRRCVALAPANAQAWHYLGKAAEQKGDLAAAIELLRNAAALNPHFAPTHNDLGALLQQTGERDAALAALDRAIAVDPDYTTAHHNRGMLLVELQRPEEARESFRRVLAARQDSADAWHNVGAAHLSLAEHEPAVAACRQALALDAGHLGAYATLAQALGHLHRNAEAAQVRTEWARRQGIVVTRCRHEPPQARVLLLGAAEFCNVPTGALFDRARFETVAFNLMPPTRTDGGPAEPSTEFRAAALPPVDVVFNAIGDADRGGPFFVHAAEFCRRLGRPVLNPPERVARTQRDALPVLLKDIPGLVVPRIRRIARADMPAFAAAGQQPQRPLLVRPAGSHGGDDLMRIEDRAELAAYAESVPADDYYVSDFWDYRGADGLFRKYRLIFIDRQVFPYHLAITRHWLAHYWRAETTDAMKREEEAFLIDFHQAFRGPAADAIREAARRLDLDYAGMDCTILPDGRVLVFEANAAMLVHLRESRTAFAYKHAHVPRIIAAIGDLVTRRIAEHRLPRSA